MTTTQVPSGPLLNRDDLRSRGITYSNTRLIRLEKAGQFPRRLRLSPGRVAWLSDEIDGWLSRLAADRSGV